MNHRAKFDAASFIPTGEIRSRIQTKTNKQKTNSKQLIYPHLAYRQVWIITLYGMSSLHFYRWNHFKVIPVDSTTVRIRNVRKHFSDTSDEGDARQLWIHL